MNGEEGLGGSWNRKIIRYSGIGTLSGGMRCLLKSSLALRPYEITRLVGISLSDFHPLFQSERVTVLNESSVITHLTRSIPVFS